MGSLLQDFRYGWRMLVHNPRLAVLAALTFGLAIGAGTTVFSWIDDVLLHPSEEEQPAFYVRAHEEILFDVFAAICADSAGEFGVREKIADLKGASFHRVNQNTGEVVDDLIGNTANGAGNRGFALPKRLGDGESEAFLQRLLNDNSGCTLDGIDLQSAP